MARSSVDYWNMNCLPEAKNNGLQLGNLYISPQTILRQKNRIPRLLNPRFYNSDANPRKRTLSKFDLVFALRTPLLSHLLPVSHPARPFPGFCDI